jgi:hypothetical protein
MAVNSPKTLPDPSLTTASVELPTETALTPLLMAMRNSKAAWAGAIIKAQKTRMSQLWAGNRRKQAPRNLGVCLLVIGIELLTQSSDTQFYPDWHFFATLSRKNFSLSKAFSRLSDNFGRFALTEKAKL